MTSLDAMPDESMSEADRLEAIARTLVGTPVWPFAVLDWFYARRRDDSQVDRVQHLSLARRQLNAKRADPATSLRHLIVISAELLAPDVRKIAAQIEQFLSETGFSEITIEDSVMLDLSAAGLSSRTITRLGLTTAGPPTKSAQVPESGVVPLKTFISYSHEGEDVSGPWMSRVRKFAALLMKNGVPCEIDQFGNHMGRDWSIWGPEAVRQADVVLCLASPDYAAKWRSSKGSGAAAEARTIRVLHDQGKVVVWVVLPGRSSTDVPDDMAGFNHYIVSSLDRQGIEFLLRALTDQPRFEPPRLGRPPILPPEVLP